MKRSLVERVLLRVMWWSLRLPHPFWWEMFVVEAEFLNPAAGDPPLLTIVRRRLTIGL